MKLSHWGDFTTLTSGVAAASAIATCYYLLSKERGPPQFSVLSWNVLAREYTMYNHEPPGCVKGHRNPNNKLETHTQTAARYSLATQAILSQAPDAVLLQEFSRGFTDSIVNPMAPDLLSNFHVAHQTNDAGPGTAVLLKNGGALKATGIVTSVGATEKTGGTSKSASAVLVELEGGTSCWLVSLHLVPHKYNPAAVRAHLELLGDAIRTEANATQTPPRIIIGGDLNAEPHEVATLQREMATLGGALFRVATPGHTGLSADFAVAETIDHLFISPGLRLEGEVAMERSPGSPYAPIEESGVAAAVVGASDHVWQHIRFTLM